MTWGHTEEIIAVYDKKEILHGDDWDGCSWAVKKVWDCTKCSKEEKRGRTWLL
jgi:hypothetical protein